MDGYQVSHEGEREGEVTIHLAGRIAFDTVGGLGAELDDILATLEPSRLTVDLSGITFIDSAGAFTIFELERRAEKRSIPVRRTTPSEAVRGMMRLLRRETLEAEPLKESFGGSGFRQMVGTTSLDIFDDVVGTMTFLGEFILSGLSVVRHPRLFRARDVFEQLGRVGMDGLPLVGVIDFMLGFVVALMAFDQLRQYGAIPVLPTVVTKAMVEQFGPLITAILVAGRSGSAFAAEIASMQINDEVDALRIMGFNPVRFLALPRVLATIVAVPVLSVYGNLLGILGGLVVGVADGGMSVASYVQGVPLSITTADVLESLIKSAVFGALVAGIGCQRGFRARKGPAEVGTCTTSSVVSAIFLIILTDALAALVISRLGI
jgi:phospholipid/cholesterol/gamma-HCH transport system permease protein